MPRRSPASVRIIPNVWCLQIYPTVETKKDIRDLQR
jgi:hypothetical protein